MAAAQPTIAEIWKHISDHSAYPDSLTPSQCQDVKDFTTWIQANPIDGFDANITLKKAVMLMRTKTVAPLDTDAPVETSAEPEPAEPDQTEPEPPDESAVGGIDAVDPDRVGNVVIESNFDGMKRRGTDPVTVPLPPAELPEDPRRAPIHGNSNVRNGLNLVITPADTCHHLNAWKGGCCMIKGHEPCPYLGGNQGDCSEYTEKQAPPPRRWGSRRGQG